MQPEHQTYILVFAFKFITPRWATSLKAKLIRYMWQNLMIMLQTKNLIFVDLIMEQEILSWKLVKIIYFQQIFLI